MGGNICNEMKMASSKLKDHQKMLNIDFVHWGTRLAGLTSYKQSKKKQENRSLGLEMTTNAMLLVYLQASWLIQTVWSSPKVKFIVAVSIVDKFD